MGKYGLIGLAFLLVDGCVHGIGQHLGIYGIIHHIEGLVIAALSQLRLLCDIVVGIAHTVISIVLLTESRIHEESALYIRRISFIFCRIGYVSHTMLIGA